jgi:hypothetical protein
MDTLEPQGHGTVADILTSEVANARQRIHRTELALQRTEEMLAENLALRDRIRTAVEAADRLVKIDPPALKDVARVELGRRFIRRALQATGATTLAPELCQPHLRLGCTLANSRNQRRPQAVYQSKGPQWIRNNGTFRYGTGASPTAA